MKKRTQTEYQREYRKKNREKINSYKKIWAYNTRHGIKTSNKVKVVLSLVQKEMKRINTLRYYEKCINCEILLSSPYASGGNKDCCGDCLKDPKVLQKLKDISE